MFTHRIIIFLQEKMQAQNEWKCISSPLRTLQIHIKVALDNSGWLTVCALLNSIPFLKKKIELFNVLGQAKVPYSLAANVVALNPVYGAIRNKSSGAERQIILIVTDTPNTPRPILLSFREHVRNLLNRGACCGRGCVRACGGGGGDGVCGRSGSRGRPSQPTGGGYVGSGSGQRPGGGAGPRPTRRAPPNHISNPTNL